MPEKKSAVDATIVEDVAATNASALGHRPPGLVNSGHENIQAHQQRLWSQQADAQGAASAASGVVTKMISELDISESEALAALERSTIPDQAMSAGAAGGVAQVLSKVAGNAPPVTP